MTGVYPQPYWRSKCGTQYAVHVRALARTHVHLGGFPFALRQRVLACRTQVCLVRPQTLRNPTTTTTRLDVFAQGLSITFTGVLHRCHLFLCLSPRVCSPRPQVFAPL
jgi:hypothetical protein